MMMSRSTADSRTSAHRTLLTGERASLVMSIATTVTIGDNPCSRVLANANRTESSTVNQTFSNLLTLDSQLEALSGFEQTCHLLRGSRTGPPSRRDAGEGWHLRTGMAQVVAYAVAPKGRTTDSPCAEGESWRFLRDGGHI